MAASARNHINHFSVPVPRPGQPDSIGISTPAAGLNVPQDFTATGVLGAPDQQLQSCDVGGQAATSIATDASNPPNWTAAFNNVNVSYPNQVPLTARGDAGGIDCVLITVGGPPPTGGAVGAGDVSSWIALNPGDTCSGAAAGQEMPGFKRTDMLLTIRVKRRNPHKPDGFALRLAFRGSGKHRFIVGGTLATPGDRIEKCFAGEHMAQHILHRDGEWQAVFENVLPGAHVLTVATKSGATDQARILIAAKE